MAVDVPLVPMYDLELRLDFSLDEDEYRVAEAALEDLSNEARFHGSSSWSTPETTPSYARTLILKAAQRYMKNLEGYVESKAGDEAVAWAKIPEIMGTASFTKAEEKRLSQIARPSALLVSSTYAYSNRRVNVGLDRYRVPVYGGGKQFPFMTDLEASSDYSA